MSDYIKTKCTNKERNCKKEVCCVDCDEWYDCMKSCEESVNECGYFDLEYTEYSKGLND